MRAMRRQRRPSHRSPRQPVATWFSAQDDNPFLEADRVTSAAAAQGQLPVLVAYHRPGRDCGSYSAGGSPDPASYLAWVEQLAAGVGDRPGLVVLEPDAVAQSVSGACGGRQDLVMLAQAVHVLKKQPRVRVYIDAGHPGWISDLSSLAEALKASGLEQADGFSLNVSNFRDTTEVVDYGERLSQLLGGRPSSWSTCHVTAGAPRSPPKESMPGATRPKRLSVRTPGSSTSRRSPWRSSGSRSPASPMATAVPANPRLECSGRTTPGA